MNELAFPSPAKILESLKKGDLAFVAALFGTVILLVVPVGPVLLDLLLATSIAISLLILLIIVYVKEPEDFSGFPTLLLSVTLYRLALNVASTRLILVDGHAGNIIQAFGDFVVRGNYVVGAVVFLILVVINFMVITKGAGRIAEVAARFTLDAMPGKQMSIDAELNAGLIDEGTATRRRLKIQKEADFYGAMDGASKFVRGDAIAGILITLINIIGGIVIGVVQKNMPVAEALKRYTLLSIGDGLVAQVPALVVSLAAGILVTRASEDSDLGSYLSKQLTFYPRAMGIAAGMMGIFAVVPGMPVFPFLSLAIILGVLAWKLKQTETEEAEKAAVAAVANASKNLGSGSAPASERSAAAGDGKPRPISEEFKKLMEVDVLCIELGLGLVGLADKKTGGDLLDRVTGVRRNFARDMGMVIPPIAIRDSLDLENSEYRFLLRGREISRGKVLLKHWLAMNVSNSPIVLRGVPTVEPVFGIKATWVDDEERRTAEIHGFTVVDPSSVLITHLSETMKRQAHLILGRQDVQTLLDSLKETQPVLVSDVVPDPLGVGVVQRVLQNLLREGVSIKNLPSIMENLGDVAAMTKNPDELSEHVRRRLGTYFVAEYESEPGILKAVTIEPRLEQLLTTKVHRTQFDVGLVIDPQMAQHLLQELSKRMAEMAEKGLVPVLITTSELRLAFRRFFEPSLAKLVVISYQELPSQTEIKNVGILLPPPVAQSAA
ncbi:MAG: flagellar biosynthesis protein FlhA [Verrucomicrobia bacterium]|nr:MAG: flagellar biosynthesis protein FlhA [Verrucomicrobiota bacterium]